jgi:MerR family transcriptional regulator, redox-sensitive transcriptional activator SoxR
LHKLLFERIISSGLEVKRDQGEKEMETLLTIGEVARQAGIRTSTLRYYEQMGLLAATMRVQGGHRRYASDVFQRLAVLQLAKRAGLTLAEMQQLLAGFPASIPASERWQVLVPQKIQEVEALLDRLQQTKHLLQHLLVCECLQVEECARRSEAQAHTSVQKG